MGSSAFWTSRKEYNRTGERDWLGDNEEQRLSDGRSAQTILDAMEAAVGVGRSRSSTVWGLVAVAHESWRLLRGVTVQDREVVLHAANARWPQREAGSGDAIGLWKVLLKQQTVYGAGLKAFVKASQVLRRGNGKAPDTRDMRGLADAYIERVWELADRYGTAEGGAPACHLQQARREVLKGLPADYRSKVLEAILDREEEVLRAKGGTPGELASIRRQRESRETRGWCYLVAFEDDDGRGR